MCTETVCVFSEPSNNVASMRVDELRVFESVREVRDFIQIQLNDPSFVSLRFLRNLRFIQGQRLGQ